MILCSGNIVHDIIARPVTGAEWGTTTFVEEMGHHLGGNGANTAYTLAKLGAQVALLGMVGDDDLGRRLIGELQNVGVDTQNVARSGTAPTAATMALVNASGERAFFHRPGASAEAFNGPIGFESWRGKAARYHLANPFSLTAFRAHAAASLANAKAAGLSTSMDLGWDAFDEWNSIVDPCLPHTDMLFLNEAEGRCLTGHQNPASIARSLRSGGAKEVIVKLGPQGCAVFADRADFTSPAFDVPAVDTTGAGDCFSGAFLAAIRRGMNYPQAARMANGAAALSIQRLGAVANLKGFDEILSWTRCLRSKRRSPGAKPAECQPVESIA